MIHLRPIPKAQTHPRADVRVRSKQYSETHRRLRQELEEEAISREMVAAINADKRARKVEASKHWKQTGEPSAA